MFRMLQAVEREPSASSSNSSPVPHEPTNGKENHANGNGSATTQSIVQRENPHKYLLYKPSFAQFYTYAASAFKDLPPHGVFLMYISADGSESHLKIQTNR